LKIKLQIIKLSLYVEETTSTPNLVGFTSREGNLAQTPTLSVDYITCDPNAECTTNGNESFFFKKYFQKIEIII